MDPDSSHGFVLTSSLPWISLIAQIKIYGQNLTTFGDNFPRTIYLRGLKEKWRTISKTHEFYNPLGGSLAPRILKVQE